MMRLVAVRPRLRLVARKSAAVSPTVVARILTTQKNRVTSGTLLSIALAMSRRSPVIPRVMALI